MEGRTATTGMIKLMWSLVLGLGLALGLLWALMSRSAADVQTANSDFTVDLTYEAVWGMVNPGDTVTVNRSARSAAYGAAEAGEQQNRGQRHSQTEQRMSQVIAEHLNQGDLENDETDSEA